jgi:hypothetical protein
MSFLSLSLLLSTHGEREPSRPCHVRGGEASLLTLVVGAESCMNAVFFVYKNNRFSVSCSC